MDNLDIVIVEKQIGRKPEGMKNVTKRCEHGFPQAICVLPYNEGKSFFPTTFWLTCPCLKKSVSVLESTGFLDTVRQKIESDEDFKARVLAANESYKEKRNMLMDTEFPYLQKSMEVGIGGSADPLKVKCLHMHVADYISGNDNPIGEESTFFIKEQNLKIICDDENCACK